MRWRWMDSVERTFAIRLRRGQIGRIIRYLSVIILIFFQTQIRRSIIIHERGRNRTLKEYLREESELLSRMHEEISPAKFERDQSLCL